MLAAGILFDAALTRRIEKAWFVWRTDSAAAVVFTAETEIARRAALAAAACSGSTRIGILGVEASLKSFLQDVRKDDAFAHIIDFKCPPFLVPLPPR